MSNRLSIVALTAVTALSVSMAIPSIAEAAPRDKNAKQQVQNRPLPNVQRTTAQRPVAQPRTAAPLQKRIEPTTSLPRTVARPQSRITHRTPTVAAQTGPKRNLSSSFGSAASGVASKLNANTKIGSVVANVGKELKTGIGTDKKVISHKGGAAPEKKVIKSSGKGSTTPHKPVDMKNLDSINAKLQHFEKNKDVIAKLPAATQASLNRLIGEMKVAKAALEKENNPCGPQGCGGGKTDPAKPDGGKGEGGEGDGKGGGKGGPIVIVNPGHGGHGGPHWQHRPHWQNFAYGRPYIPAPRYEAPAPVYVAPVAAAPAPVKSCVTKEYLPNGPVLFRDTCKNEWAMNTTTVAASPVNPACLTKDYVQPGVVLFKDTCTNEWAMNPPAEQQAEVQ